jgi:hypothetical protein
MATRGPALITFDPEKKSHVAVGLEPGGKTIKVSRDHFTVSKSKDEVVEWFCLRHLVEQGHKHGKECFTVSFNKDDCPFVQNHQFGTDVNGYACSTKLKPDVKPKEKIYKYTIQMNGKTPLDPTGGVEP